MKYKSILCRFAYCIMLGCSMTPNLASAEDIHIAVAANFTAPMKTIAENFERSTGNKLALSFGATGQFYAQIKQGAPYDILLAADAATPARMEQEGLAVAGSRFTYASGKLVLWSSNPAEVDNAGAILKIGKFAHIALANPKLAPYGAAAVEVLTHLGLMQTLAPKFVMGEDISQTFQFVSTGNAELGFVALSQVYKQGSISSGSGWIVPAALYTPIRQDAVLLNRARSNPVAQALLKYLESEPAKAVIRDYGYAL